MLLKSINFTALRCAVDQIFNEFYEPDAFHRELFDDILWYLFLASFEP